MLNLMLSDVEKHNSLMLTPLTPVATLNLTTVNMVEWEVTRHRQFA